LQEFDAIKKTKSPCKIGHTHWCIISLSEWCTAGWISIGWTPVQKFSQEETILIQLDKYNMIEFEVLCFRSHPPFSRSWSL